MWKDNIQNKNMLYLLYCSIRGIEPDPVYLQNFDPEQLLSKCISHKVVALINNEVSRLPQDIISGEMKSKFHIETLKALRVNILFDQEKIKIFEQLENNKIWFMPLKGCIIQDYYPGPGQRQMGDIDVLISKEKADLVNEIMTSCGYSCEEFGLTHHDEYVKPPFYTFEMHRYLFRDKNEKWDVYYKNIKEKLVLKPGKKYEYEFTKEDFYIYFFMHGYNHFIKTGIGIRQLVDTYLYLSKNNLDFSYIEKELEKLGTSEGEKIFRNLAYKIFSDDIDLNDYKLDETEDEYLSVILHSGVYGSLGMKIQNTLKQNGKNTKASKFRYIMKRVFCIPKPYSRKYPRLYKNILTRPLIVGIRLCNGVTKRKQNVKNELDILKKIE